MTNKLTRLLKSTPIMHTSMMRFSIRLQGTRMSRKPLQAAQDDLLHFEGSRKATAPADDRHQ